MYRYKSYEINGTNVSIRENGRENGDDRREIHLTEEEAEMQQDPTNRSYSALNLRLSLSLDETYFFE